MKGLFLLPIVFFFSFTCLCQSSDFIILKKNQRTIKSYFADSPIEFTSVDGYHSGQISSIQNDSFYLNEYDIRQMPTTLGVYILDTVAVYKTPFYYKDILMFGARRTKGFNWGASGLALVGGAILIVGAGLISWIFTKPGTTYHASPALVGGAAALGGAGYLIYKLSSKGIKIGKKYQLNYVSVNNTPSHK